MRAVAAAFLLMIAGLLAGCVDDAGQSDAVDDLKPKVDRAVTTAKELPATITGILHVAHAEEVESGSGIWLYGHHAYVAGLGSGLWIVDIMDPAAPVVVGHLDTIGEGDDEVDIYARDVDFLDQGDRLIAVAAAQGGGMHFIDVTNASAPVYLTAITDIVSHNVAVPPGQNTIVYNSRSNGEGGVIDVIDVTNPDLPAVVGEFGTHGCHDIMFLDLPDKKRAYCAGVTATQIYDTADLMEPTLITNIDWTQGPHVGGVVADQRHYGLHHLAMPNQDGTILILGDEWQGGGSPGGCFGYADIPVAGGSVSTPMGALTFYDVSDETAPELLSWITPPTPEPRPGAAAGGNAAGALPSCTAHFGTLIEDRPQLVMGWYTAGVLLIDFSDPTAPYIVDQIQSDGTNVWDARFYQGYVFTGDTSRGLDVLAFE